MKDGRYYRVGNLIRNGDISFFNEIYEIIPKSQLAHDLGIGYTRMEALIERVELFKLGELGMFADLAEVDLYAVLLLADCQYARNQML